MVEVPSLDAPIVGAAAGGALFALAMGVLVWPFARQLVTAHRKRAHELRVAAGETDDRKGMD